MTAKETLRSVRRLVPAPLLAAATVLRPGGTARRQALTASRARPVVDATASVRLLIAPANFAGQGYLWARACEEHLRGVQARNMSVRSPYDFDSDYVVDPVTYRDPLWAREQVRHVRGLYTHVMVEAERPLFGTFYSGTRRELPVLRKAGIAVALLSHGSDVRVPSEHARLHPHSPFDDPTDDLQLRLEAIATRNRELLTTYDGAVFVSTPDLIDHVPRAAWLPTVVRPQEWRSQTPLLERSRPLVLHVPSNSRLKGSELIDPTLRDLHDEGIIDYRSPRGLTHEQVRAAVREADIVLDQFVLGMYGVAALEAMAAGRLVVGSVAPHVRARIEDITGLAVPIVDADPENLREVLLGLVHDPDGARGRATAGQAFVEQVHDGRLSARVLSGFLGVRPAVGQPD